MGVQFSVDRSEGNEYTDERVVLIGEAIKQFEFLKGFSSSVGSKDIARDLLRYETLVGNIQMRFLSQIGYWKTVVTKIEEESPALYKIIAKLGELADKENAELKAKMEKNNAMYFQKAMELVASNRDQLSVREEIFKDLIRAAKESWDKQNVEEEKKENK